MHPWRSVEFYIEAMRFKGRVMARARTVEATAHLFPFLIVIAVSLTTPATTTFDHCGVVTRVVDGDTLYVSGLPVRVRLADIDAPELGTAGGEAAKAALAGLAEGRRICLDIGGRDRYGRYVAVAYLDYNETHWLNVNQWLAANGYAEYRDYPNQFHPPWPLYVEKAARETRTVTATVTLMRTVTDTVTETRTATRTLTTTKTVTHTRTATITATETTTETRYVTITATGRDGGVALGLGLALVALALLGVAKLMRRS